MIHLWWLSVSWAGFAPDRPGVGDSTEVVPQGATMVEVGSLLGAQLGASPVLALPAFTGRIGLRAERWEARVSLPSLLIDFEGPALSTRLGLGAKWATPIGEDAALSVVPAVSLPVFGQSRYTAPAGVGLGLNASRMAGSGDWGGWLAGQAELQTTGDVGTLAGGGLFYAPDDVGVFLDASYTDAVEVGGGGWWAFAPSAQADIGVSLMPGYDVVMVRAGAAVQR